MKCLDSLIAELCLSPCCKLGNAAFWERLLLGRCPAKLDDESQTFRFNGRFLTHLSGPCGNVELIEILRRGACRKSKNEARIGAFAVRTSDSFTRVEHAPKTDHSIE
jgi:hypothetical protein